jgi:L-ascorbate metabolism protein UlaG (beta-lactamase superfamily)
MSLEILGLGQSGVRMAFSDTVVYIDPYLTDRVADVHGPWLSRQLPPPIAPDAVRDARWVLVTHAHADHADPATLGPMATASPEARFVCPPPAVEILTDAGIDRDRIQFAEERWTALSPTVSMRAVPAAHLELERTADGRPACVGYLLEADGRRVYHAGDTVPHPEIAAVVADRPIDFALLPVNERNYYRDALGIVGNMSVREALQMATEIGASALIPIHWDLFAINSTPRAEIELLHRLLQPELGLRFCASGTSERLWQ